MKNIRFVDFKIIIKKVMAEFFWLAFGLTFVPVMLYLGMSDDRDYCLDSGFRAGDPMCQADENNKLVIVKE